jgi:hypothetical protein
MRGAPKSFVPTPAHGVVRAEERIRPIAVQIRLMTIALFRAASLAREDPRRIGEPHAAVEAIDG